MPQAPRPKRRAGRPWPVTVLTLLLLLQSAGLFTIGALSLLSTSLRYQITLDTLTAELPHAARGALFVALALVALLASFSFFRRRPAAWLSAVLVQGLTLFFALGLYLRDERPPYSYVMMLYGILMLIYLNYGDVPAAFRPKREILDPRDV